MESLFSSLQRLMFVAGVVVLLGTLGCSDSGAAKTHKVSGKVTTADGAPVKGAAVTFTPTGKGFGANGVTGEDGAYQLSTFNENDGAAEGEYDVVVSGPDSQPLARADGTKSVTVKPGSNTFDFKVDAPKAAAAP